MPPKVKGDSLIKRIAQPVLIAGVLGICGAAFSTYLNTRDLVKEMAGTKRRLNSLSRRVDATNGKLDWLYKYNFPGVKAKNGATLPPPPTEDGDDEEEDGE